MTLPLMTFLAFVSVLGGLAGLLTEAGLRRVNLPTRWTWLTSMALGPLLLLAGLVASTRGVSGFNGGPAVFSTVELPTLFVGRDPSGVLGAVWGLAPALLWIASGTIMVAVLFRAHAALRRERSLWDRHEVLGRHVLVSRDRGPAVAGVLRSYIVLPRWALSLPEPELQMVLLHEEEHAAANDPALLVAGLVLVVFSAWNPVTWWQLRRLKQAMEADCDRRVLDAAPDRAIYGQSLLTVAARASASSLALAAFTEDSRSLRRRILIMTAKSSRWTGVGGTLLIAMGVVVGVQACGVDNPMGPEVARQETVVEAVAPDISAAPTFTPFTVAPSILNRREVITAMEGGYPPLLREAGIGGTIRVYFFIGADGEVKDVRIDQSSGHQALDDAAMSVAEVYRFSPALNRDEPVPVWVSFPITFQVR